MISARYIPNLITSIRIVLVPCLVWLLLQGEYERALWVALFMGVSDALDGFLARSYGWSTTLGAYLDPLADKAMLISVYIAYAYLGWLPIWVSAIVILRDLILLGGAISYHLATRKLEMEPSSISKINTFMQIMLAVLLLYSQLDPIHPGIINLLITLVVWTTLASGASYVIEWRRRASKILHKQA